MQSLITSGYGLLALQVLAFYPVWRWYGRRVTDGSDEPWGLLALLTALVLLVLDREAGTAQRRSLLVPALVTLLYAITYPFVPRLVQAAIALTAVGSVVSVIRTGKQLPAAILGLCILSVPVISSLQFYCGYPLRVVSGMVASALLNVSGLAVCQDGACLRWAGGLVAIDAACSGVRMLWVGLYLAFTIAAVSRAGYCRTAGTAAVAVVLVILGNALRAASLFHLETGMVTLPGWAHDAVGVVVFAITGTAIAWFVVLTGNLTAIIKPSESRMGEIWRGR
jgi:exosortase